MSAKTIEQVRVDRWSFYNSICQGNCPEAPIDLLIRPLVDLAWCCGSDIVPVHSCQGHPEAETLLSRPTVGKAERLALRTGNFQLVYRYTMERRGILLTSLCPSIEVCSSSVVKIPRKCTNADYGGVTYRWWHDHRTDAIACLISILEKLRVTPKPSL